MTIDCHRCKYYYVTWEKDVPHGCRSMGFKSKELPSMVVLTSSSRKCLLYEEKKTKDSYKRPT